MCRIEQNSSNEFGLLKNRSRGIFAMNKKELSFGRSLEKRHDVNVRWFVDFDFRFPRASRWMLLEKSVGIQGKTKWRSGIVDS